MSRIKINFTECEHNDDLEHYISDINKCGGKVIERSIDTEIEEAEVIIEADDTNRFWTAFRLTSSYYFTE